MSPKITGVEPAQSNIDQGSAKSNFSWAFFDSQLDKYRTKNVSQSSKRLLNWILATPRFVINWFKVYEPRWRTTLAIIVLFAIVSSLFFISSNLSQAASYTFVQTDWIGGTDPATIVHPTNQTGWTKYTAGTNADASVSGTARTSTYADNFSETFTSTTYRDAANSTSGGTITQTNVRTHGPVNGTNISAAAISHTTGNAVIIYIGWEDGGSLSSVTDTALNTYTLLNESHATGVGAGGPYSRIAYNCNVTGNASNVVTAHMATAVVAFEMTIIQYSGLRTSSCIDQQNTNDNGAGSGSSLTSGNIVTTVANEVIISGGRLNNTADFSGSASYTEVSDLTNSAVYERIVSSTGTYSNTITATASDSWVTSIASFKGSDDTWTTSGQLAVPGGSGSANAQSLTVDSNANNILSATLTKNDTVGSGTLTYYLSNDGSTFNQVTPATPYTFSAAGSDLRFKVALTGNATVQDISIAFSGYYATADLTSSAYDTGDNTNLITKVAWTASVPASQTVKFQVRSAPDSSGVPGTWSSWCGYADCSGSTYFDTGDNNVTLGGSHPLRSSANDRWFQYKIFFTSNGLNTAVVNDITITYVVNAPPQFDTDYPTAAAGGASGAQVTNSASSDYGKVLINYRIRDTDTSTGTTNPGFVTPSFEYYIGGGWVAITGGNLGASDLTNKAVDGSTYTTYTATWNAQAQIPTTYTTSAQVRVTINDNEAANSTAQATSAVFTLDTKVPVVSAFTANSSTDVITLTAADDTALQYRISNNSDYSADGVNGSSGSWQSAGGNSISVTPSWVFAGSPNEQVYAQVRDSAGNVTSVSAKIPIAVSNPDIKDISNEEDSNYREFVSWGVYSSVAGATFASYKVYRSTDGSSYSLVSTITDIAINYFADFSLDTDETYYYKIAVVDSNGDISNYSTAVSDQPNGQGGTDTSPPVITSVTVAETQATYVKITWTTDEISDSRVDYSLSPSTAFGSGQTNSSFVTSHSITITGLTPGMPYLFRAKSIDILGNTGTNDNSGDGFAFTTSSGPLISNVTETLVNENTATIFWNTNVDSGSFVTYSTNSNLSSSTRVGSATLVGGTNPFQHTVGLTGLATGTTYYYFVESTDGSANTSYDKNGNNYYSFRTTTDTVAPVISNVQTPVIAPTAGVVVWQTDELATTKLNWGAVSGALIGTTPDNTLSIFHVVSLTGLAEDTEYFFEPVSSDGAGNETTDDEDSFTTGVTTVIQQITTSGGGGGGGGSTVTLDTTAPKISNIKLNNLSSFSATITFDTDEDTVGFVQYGKEADALSSTAGTAVYAKSHSIKFNGLSMGTDYFYQVKAVDKGGNIATSTSDTFKTQFFTESTINIGDAEAFQKEVEDAIEAALPSLVPPFISKPAVSQITDNSAVVTWNTNLKSYSVVSYAMENEYDKTRENPYAIEISNTTDKVQEHSMLLQDLNPNTRYHFRAKSFSIPRSVGMSDDLQFVTKALNIKAQITDIGNSSFRVSWRTSEPTSSVVEYRNTKTGELNQKSIDEIAVSHDITVDNLTPATTYEVSVFGTNAKGNKVETASAVKITTSKDIASPEIQSLKIDTAIVPGRNDRTQTIVSWKTNEPSTSIVYFEEGTGTANSDPTKPLANKVEITNSFVLDHAVVLSVLKPGGLYRIQVASVDTAGNRTSLPTKTIVVPRQSESILDVIFKNFEDTFKFLRKVGN